MGESAADASVEPLVELKEQAKQIGSTAAGTPLLGGLPAGATSAGALNPEGLGQAFSRLRTSAVLTALQSSVGNAAAASTFAPRPLQRDNNGGSAGGPGDDPNKGLPPGGLPEGHIPDPNAHVSGQGGAGGKGDGGADGGGGSGGGPPAGGGGAGGAPPGGVGTGGPPKAPPTGSAVPPVGSPPADNSGGASGPTPGEGMLDDRIAAVMDQRKDPVRAENLANVLTNIDTARLGTVSYSFTPSGVGHVLGQMVWPSDAVVEHARALGPGNAYGNEGGFVEFIEGLRGVLRILGDIAAAVAAIAGIVALIGAAFAWTGVGAVVMGVAADVAAIAGIVKIVTDLLDMVIGMFLMARNMRRLHESSNPAERARFAALTKKEAADTSAAAVSFGIGLVTTIATAGMGAALQGETKSLGAFGKAFMKNALGPLAAEERAVTMFGEEIAPKTFGRQAAGAIKDGSFVGVGLTGAARSAALEARFGVGMAFRLGEYLQVEALRDSIIADAKIAIKVGAAGVVLGTAGTEAQTQGKVAAGVGGSQPDATPGAEAKGGSSVSLDHVPVWPSGLKDISDQQALISSARTRMLDWRKMALADASPEAREAVQAVIGTVEEKHTHHKAAAAATQQQADESKANLTRAQQQLDAGGDKTGSAKQQQEAMKAKAASASAKVAAAPKEPPGLIERAMSWFGDKMNALTLWVQSKLMNWMADMEHLTPDERKMVGMKDETLTAAQVEEQSKKDAAAAEASADSTQKAVTDLKSKADRRDQNAIQAVSDTTKYLDMLDAIDDELTDEATEWTAAMAQVAPQIAHELDISGGMDQPAQGIDAAYVEPITVKAGTAASDFANVTAMVQGQGDVAVSWARSTVVAAKGKGDEAAAMVSAQVASSIGGLKAAAESFSGKAVGIASQATAKVGSTDYDGVHDLAKQMEAVFDGFTDAAAEALGNIGQSAQGAVKTQSAPAKAGQPAGDTPAAPPPDPTGTPGSPPPQVPASAVA